MQPFWHKWHKQLLIFYFTFSYIWWLYFEKLRTLVEAMQRLCLRCPSWIFCPLVLQHLLVVQHPLVAHVLTSASSKFLWALQCKIFQYKFLWQYPIKFWDFFSLRHIQQPAWLKLDYRKLLGLWEWPEVVSILDALWLTRSLGASASAKSLWRH